jgi:DNA-binding LacI/PurR family transcriptional regulator
VTRPRTDIARPPTIYDVARLAGVSHQTVSRHLRDQPGISEKTRTKVDDAVQQLGYRTNTAAQALAMSGSKRIVAVVLELTQFAPAAIVKGASCAARKAGYVLDILSLDESDHTSIGQALDIVAKQDAAGVFIVGPRAMVDGEVQTRTFPMPVFLEFEEPDPPSGVPLSLNGLGTELAMNELIALGHTRIGHVGGPLGWTSAMNRELGYRRALQREGLPTLPVRRGDWSAASGYEIGLSWPLELGATALFVANDHMAFGLLSALRERGVSVPDELSIVGFDDIPEAEFMAPPLSTVRLDFVREGERRFTELIGQIEGTSSGQLQKTSSGQLQKTSSGQLQKTSSGQLLETMPEDGVGPSDVELIRRRSIRPVLLDPSTVLPVPSDWL